MDEESSKRRSANTDEAEWYWVCATYKALHVGSRRKRHLWERVVFLVQAPTPDEVPAVAEDVARGKEHEYLAAGGDTVRWVLQEIERIEPVLDRHIGQGTEVYSEFFERVDK